MQSMALGGGRHKHRRGRERGGLGKGSGGVLSTLHNPNVSCCKFASAAAAAVHLHID